MKVKDILPIMPIETVEVRCNTPDWYPQKDMLFGYCRWDGKNLISSDGDSYHLDEEVKGYEYNGLDNSLTYWIHVTWTEL